MPDTKISAMTDGGYLLPTDVVPVVRGGANRRVVVPDSYFSTMLTANTAAANATALAADIAAANGKDIVIPPGTYMLDEITLSNETIVIDMMVGAVFSTTVVAQEYFFTLTDCNLYLKRAVFDGDGKAQSCIRMTGGTLSADYVEYYDMGYLGTNNTVLVGCMDIRELDSIRIGRIVGRGCNAEPNEVLGVDGIGSVRGVYLVDCGYCEIDHFEYDAVGTDGEEIDFFYSQLGNLGGIIGNFVARYNHNTRRCAKVQTGNWVFKTLDIRKSSDFTPYDGTTDVGARNLDAISWATVSDGSLDIMGGYADVSGFATGIAAAGGPARTRVHPGLTLIGGTKTVNRPNPDAIPPFSSNQTNQDTFAFFAGVTAVGSGIMGARIVGFTKPIVLASDKCYAKYNILLDPVKGIADLGVTGSTKNDIEFIGNKIYTVTADYLANTQLVRVFDVRDARVHFNELSQDGNITHSVRFIEFTVAAGTGVCIGNIAPVSPAVDVVRENTSVVSEILSNMVLLSNKLSFNAEVDFNTQIVANSTQKYFAVTGGTQTISQFSSKDWEFQYTLAGGCTVTIPDTIPVGTRFKMNQKGGELSIVGSGSMVIKTVGGLAKSKGLNSIVHAEVTATNECTLSGDILRSDVVTTAVGNVGTGEDDLISYTLPIGALLTAKRGVRITAWGTGANNVDSKSLKLYFGSVAILTAALTISQANTWKIVAEVFSTAVDAQDYMAQFTQGGTVIQMTQERGTLTQDDGATIVVKCTGDATSNNDIVQEGLFIELF